MKIIWTEFAISSLRSIYKFYSIQANKTVADKLRQIFNSVKQLRKNPESGALELNLEKLKKGHRNLICLNYKVIYRIIKDEIIISDVFDKRQNPEKMIDSTKNVSR